MGDVIGDLNSRRGRIESMEDRGMGKVVTAFVPLAELFGYTTDIRSMTQGRAASSMELDHYADVPPNVATAIIAKNENRTLCLYLNRKYGIVHPMIRNQWLLSV